MAATNDQWATNSRPERCAHRLSRHSVSSRCCMSSHCERGFPPRACGVSSRAQWAGGRRLVVKSCGRKELLQCSGESCRSGIPIASERGPRRSGRLGRACVVGRLWLDGVGPDLQRQVELGPQAFGVCCSSEAGRLLCIWMQMPGFLAGTAELCCASRCGMVQPSLACREPGCPHSTDENQRRLEHNNVER